MKIASWVLSGVLLGGAGLAWAEGFDSSRFGGEAQTESFDSSRFGEATFDNSRFGEAVGGDLFSSVYTPDVDSQTTGGIQNDAAQAAAPAAAAGAERTVSNDEFSNQKCAMGAGEAADVATNEASFNEVLANNPVAEAPSAQCKAAIKKMYAACGAGNSAAFSSAKSEAGQKCAEQEPPQYDTAVPVGANAPGVAEAGATIQQGLANAAQNMANGVNILPNASGMNVNGLQQMVVNAAAQGIVEKLFGGSGSSSDSSSSSGSGTSTDTSTGVVTYTCDSVSKQVSQTSKVEVVSGVTVKTVVTTNTCANGNKQVITAVAKDNGKTVETTTTNTVSPY